MNSETITVQRLGRDRHGDPTVVSEHTIAGVVVAPTGTTEDVSTGDRVTGRYDLYVPADADVRATDRVRRPSDPDPGEGASVKSRAPWIVVGDPAVWKSPFGFWTPGAVVQIERVSG